MTRIPTLNDRPSALPFLALLGMLSTERAQKILKKANKVYGKLATLTFRVAVELG